MNTYKITYTLDSDIKGREIYDTDYNRYTMEVTDTDIKSAIHQAIKATKGFYLISVEEA